MSAPSITLNATLQDFAGNPIGAVGTPSKICIALCGFGNALPRIGGTSLVAQVVRYLESTNGTFTTPLWGNDVITPSGTYYTIELLDQFGNVVQAGAYQLTGSGTFDLSNLTPYVPITPVPSGYVFVPFSATPIFNGAGWPGPVTFDLTLTGNVTSSTIVNVRPGQIVQFIIAQDAAGNHTFTWPTNVKNPPLINTAALSVSTANFIVRADGNLYPQLGWS